LARKAENEDATVASWPAPANTEGEFHENEIRKDFTPSERVAIGRTLEKEIGERRGRPSKTAANAADIQGKTADHVASQIGFGSEETYGRAKKVVDQGAPELVEAMDKEEVSISAAAPANVPHAGQMRHAAQVKPRPNGPERGTHCTTVPSGRSVACNVSIASRIRSDRCSPPDGEERAPPLR
jgi:hypothetical protein